MVGHHRLRVVVPKGWEHLDHGQQQIFRLNEHVISLTDLGPATPEGMMREVAAARDLSTARPSMRGRHPPGRVIRWSNRVTPKPRLPGEGSRRLARQA